ncbi:hypothetical protein L7F22_038130 [Adiantum nelumboides]|nr:hypothetical protein [Adiantum nelumboides]
MTCWQALMQAGLPYDLSMGARKIRVAIFSGLDCVKLQCEPSEHPSAIRMVMRLATELAGEQEARPNNNSVRGFEVVDDIKVALEQECPGIVSCADILAMAARDSVAESGGPPYRVLLGRRDSLTASRSLANQMLPGFYSNVSDLVASFANFNLSLTDMVALSGGHTIGKARCSTFAARLTPNADAPPPSSPPAGAASNSVVDLDVTSHKTLTRATTTIFSPAVASFTPIRCSTLPPEPRAT